MTHGLDEPTHERLLKGLAYLRRHAFNAHHTGDGMQVLHFTSLAVRKCFAYNRKRSNARLDVYDIRWAFILGMYWLRSEAYHYEINFSWDKFAGGKKYEFERNLIVSIHNQLYEPHVPLNDKDIAEIENIPSRLWLTNSSNQGAGNEEDFLALTFLIELIWYQDRDGNRWRRLCSKWIENCPSSHLFKEQLIALFDRLEFQNGFYNFNGFDPNNVTHVPINDRVTRDIFEGWAAYYKQDWQQVASIIARLSLVVNVEMPSYVSLFYLTHLSRISRESKEDQAISIPRFHAVRSKQPLQVFGIYREGHFDSEFLKIAAAGFPKDDFASEGRSCLRVAMLVCLQGLRTWDVGTWWDGLRMSSKIKMELGVRGDNEMAIDGVLDVIRGRDMYDAKKSPLFQKCLKSYDKLDVDQRREIAILLLNAPPAQWRDVHDVFCKFSDAIPEDLYPKLAEWSLMVEETDLLHNHWTHTLLKLWNDILPRATHKKELIVQLAPALKNAIISVRSWDDLHNTIIESIVHAPAPLDSELCDLLVGVNCEQDHWNSYRWSIAYNVLLKRPDLQEKVLPFLVQNTVNRDHQYQRQLLRSEQSKLGLIKRTDDAKFKKSIRDGLLQRLKDRKNLRGSSIPIGGSGFGQLATIVEWPRADRALVDAVVASIDSDKVLFSDKDDYLRFLARLVESGPKTQAKMISACALRWLTNGIPGRSLGFGSRGPLSGSGFAASSQNDVLAPLLVLTECCVRRCPEIFLKVMLEWLPLNTSQFLPTYVYYLASVEFSLVAAAANVSELSATIFSGLSETATQLSIEKKPTDSIWAFNHVVLGTCIEEFTAAAKEKKTWCLMMLAQWNQRLDELSHDASPTVRKSVAESVKLWKKSKLPKDRNLNKVEKRLKHDPRLRVRNVFDR